jgi:DNA polymerase-3 subunit epsilon
MDQGALLKTLLHELKDGVVVCDQDAKITLFNPAAEDLFSHDQLLRKGSSLYSLCFRPPVEQALRLLDFQHKLKGQPGPLPFIQFLNKKIDRDQYFRCRLSFLSPEADPENSFVLVLEDISAWYTPANPMLMKIEEFRAPMANLRAAVENLTEYPEMSPVMRSAFENVLVQETLNLTEAFNSLAVSCNVVMQAQNHLTELNAEVLFSYVAHHLHHKKIPVTSGLVKTMDVKVDIYGLLLILDYLVGKISRKQAENSLACEIHAGEQFIFLDLVWPGEFLATASMKAMLEEKLEHSLGQMTVAAILHAMEGDIWSQQHNKSKNILRLALPIVTGDNR